MNCSKLSLLWVLLCIVFTLGFLLKEHLDLKRYCLANKKLGLHVEDEDFFHKPSNYPQYHGNDQTWNVCSDESRWDNAVEIIRREHASGQYSGVAFCPIEQENKVWRQPISLNIIGSKCEPWWRRDSISLVSALLQPWMLGLEYGGGSSSMWIAQRIGFLHVVEGDQEWVNVLETSLAKYVFHGASRSKTYFANDKTEPLRYVYPDLRRHGRQEINGTFDLVVVDGRLRSMGMIHAMHLLKNSSGILVLDNSNRERYIDALRLVPKHWRRFDSLPFDQLERAELSPETLAERDYWMARDDIQTTVFLSRLPSCPPHLPETIKRTKFNASHHPGF